MELNRAQRVLAFLGIVVVLAGTGVYLLMSQGHAAQGQPGAAARPSAPATSAGPATAAASPAGPGSATPSAPDIYQWLPFSRADLAKAASTTQAFGAAYDTFSYRDSATSYVAALHGLVTNELSASLARAFGTPGVASQRTQLQQVSTAQAVISSLRTFGPSSLTFVVKIAQTMHSKQGKSQVSGQYAVTVTNTGGNWLVSDIQLASAGNA
jgi:hypothetical protein